MKTHSCRRDLSVKHLEEICAPAAKHVFWGLFVGGRPSRYIEECILVCNTRAMKQQGPTFVTLEVFTYKY